MNSLSISTLHPLNQDTHPLHPKIKFFFFFFLCLRHLCLIKENLPNLLMERDIKWRT
ncbi:unnamed protein product, partial [Vitis vinifera]|uniref:Uncharacterized protein n=1 Tax=Vitis vinifera TaxID=29760 RepID=E0CQ67_VITVI